MRTLVSSILTRLFAALAASFLAFAPGAYAQYDTPAPPGFVFAQHELDQMLAPIALYPDSLLSQILMASTYPLEVVEAAHWSRANPGQQGDDAVRAIHQMDWDASVKSLVAFPQILAVMDDKLDWTKRLGDAFLAQQAQVMNTVQHLRERAYAAGNLRPTEQLRVERDGHAIVVEPAHPQVIQVPYYDPAIVYGPWWLPAYPPVHWAPWPGYYARPGSIHGFIWSGGIPISAGFFFGGFDWHRRHARIVNASNYYYNRPPVVTRGASVIHVPRNANTVGSWRHDPAHRRGVAYRSPALSEQSGRVGTLPQARRDFGGHANGGGQHDGHGGARSGLRDPGAVPFAGRPDGRAGATGPSDTSSRGAERWDGRDGSGNRRGGRMEPRSEARERPAAQARSGDTHPTFSDSGSVRPNDTGVARRVQAVGGASAGALLSAPAQPALQGQFHSPERSRQSVEARINDARGHAANRGADRQPRLRAPTAR